MTWRRASLRHSARSPLVPGVLLASLLGACGDEPAPPAPPVEAPAVVDATPRAEPAVQREIEAGEALFFERAVCFTCHSVSDKGNMIVGPNLGVSDRMEDVLAVRAKSRRPELSPIEYVVDSMLDPDAIVVPTYAPGTMKAIDDLPLGLEDREIVQIAAYVASHGASTPLTPRDLEQAQARIALSREARAERRGGKPTMPSGSPSP